MGRDQRLNPFGAKTASGPACLKDATGRLLEVGDEVLLMAPGARMRVAAIKPVLDANAPPNMVMAILVAQEPVAAPSGTSVDGLYRLRQAAEMGDGFAERMAGAQQGQSTDDTPKEESPI